MTEAGGPQDEPRREAADPEKIYSEFLDGGGRREPEDFERLCRDHPSLEHALRILHSMHGSGKEPNACGETKSVLPHPVDLQLSKGIQAGRDALSVPQERIGPYRILQTLGEGGMGVVYLAEQTEPIRRRVAL